MKLHANAALTLNGRRTLCRRVVDEQWPLTSAAAAAEVSARCARKWVGRYRVDGDAGLRDRSSAPRRCPHRTSSGRVDAIRALRRIRMTGPQIAQILDMPLSTVSGILAREGMGRLGRLGMEPSRRYERERPGELIHIDVKKLGRILKPGHRIGTRQARPQRATTYTPDGRRIGDAGWECVHIAIDDCTRLAYAEVLDDEKAPTVVGFLARAAAFYDRHGFTVERLITDNGPGYRSTLHAACCRKLGIRHLRTRPYRPQTNGKAERFIRTMLEGWAYGAIYRNSQERTAALDGWLHHYNHHRPHSALSHKPPIARLSERTNLLSTYS